MFTDTIPLNLARELENKGFFPDISAADWDIIEADWKTKEFCYDTYAEVFDWLYKKRGIYIMIGYDEESSMWLYIFGFYGAWEIGCKTWNETANMAIRKALEKI